MIDAHLLFSQAALSAVVLFVFAGFWGCPCLALLCELIGKLTKRVFLDKLALQIARLNTLIHIAVWLGFAGGVGVLWYTRQIYPRPLCGPYTSCLLTVLGLALVGSNILIVYFASWNRCKKNKIVHIVIGLVGYVLIKPLASVPALITRIVFFTSPDTAVQTIPPVQSLFWPIGIQWAFLALSLAAVLSSLYLLLRRNQDDFGRDYYKFALPVCAKGALFACMAALVTWPWIVLLTSSKINIAGSPSLLAAFVVLGISLLLCIVIWVVIIKTATPLRFKGMILATSVFYWIFLLGTLAALWEIVGRYTGVYIPDSFMGDLLTSLGMG